MASIIKEESVETTPGQIQMQTQTLPAAVPSTLLAATSEIHAELDEKLGRANGNVYRRRPAVPNVHDGQVMVRLKKKRFVVLDYGHVPDDADIKVAEADPHSAVPAGAGRTKCTDAGCGKVGIPVLLYDTDPTETPSLYLRGGLCFTCQRNSNEKRRTNRKRKSGGTGARATGAADMNMDMNAHPKLYHNQQQHHHHLDAFFAPQAGYLSPHRINTAPTAPLPLSPPAVAPNRFRVNGDCIELNPDAIIINGPIAGTRPRGDGYEFDEISDDVLTIVRGLHPQATALVQAAGSAAGNSATAAAAAVTVDAHGNVVSVANVAPHRSEEVDAIYEGAFLGLSRATYLLTQWKASWDETLARAVVAATAAEAQANAAAASLEAVHVDDNVNDNVNVAATTAALTATADMDARALDEAVAATAAALACAQDRGDGVGIDVDVGVVPSVVAEVDAAVAATAEISPATVVKVETETEAETEVPGAETEVPGATTA